MNTRSMQRGTHLKDFKKSERLKWDEAIGKPNRKTRRAFGDNEKQKKRRGPTPPPAFLQALTEIDQPKRDKNDKM